MASDHLHDHDDDHEPAVDPRLAAAAAEGCAESRLLLSRRNLMGISAGFFASAFMPRLAYAGASSDPRLLVVVLRGGLDGLSAVVPHGDPYYMGLRGGIALLPSTTLKLDDTFGLHPAMPSFGGLFKSGEASIVHAACVPRRNRSHFDAQDNLENGFPDGVQNSNATGWLNRLLSTLPAGDPISTKGAVQVGEAPLILRGPAPVLGWSSASFNHLDASTVDGILGIYDTLEPKMAEAYRRGLAADALAEAINPGADGENVSQLRKAFRGAARMMGAANGPRIAVLSVKGFDTHTSQGGVTGALADRLAQLDTGIADFRAASPGTWADTVIVCVTEFGRTAAVNGTNGTDHGVGTVAFLAGGAVNGGSVRTDWPGLGPQQLHENNDLMATTDLRAVFKGVLRDHLGVPTTLLDDQIFPSSAGVAPMNDLIRAGAASPASPKSKVLAAAPRRMAEMRAPVRKRQIGSIAAYRRRFPS
jgi:uncharacterized protein (DUF1501 family)